MPTDIGTIVDGIVGSPSTTTVIDGVEVVTDERVFMLRLKA
jgi:hypothetical protein